MQKYVLNRGEKVFWTTVSDDYHETIRMAFMILNKLDYALKCDKTVRNLWLEFTRKNEDYFIQLTEFPPKPGKGKTNDQPKVVGYKVCGGDRPDEVLDREEAYKALLNVAGISLPEWVMEPPLPEVRAFLEERIKKHHGVWIEPVYEKPKSIFVVRESAEELLRRAAETAGDKFRKTIEGYIEELKEA